MSHKTIIIELIYKMADKSKRSPAKRALVIFHVVDVNKPVFSK
jgi:hypothetical protein